MLFLYGAEWNTIMTRAGENTVVVSCCLDESLRSLLPVMFAELEKCQKSLEGKETAQIKNFGCRHWSTYYKIAPLGNFEQDEEGSVVRWLRCWLCYIPLCTL